ncbi:MAG: glycosyltransferase, partial [Actinomycetota bacterium]|nr:glycosyltransferase [Actinomycetota bacterium]
SVTEALALGTPVLSTPVGAVRELVGDAGIIVPVSDVGALADALSSFALHPDAVQAAAYRARARMASEYGWRVIAERTLRTYERAIERHGDAS